MANNTFKYEDFTKHNYKYSTDFVNRVESKQPIHYYEGGALKEAFIKANDPIISVVKILIRDGKQFDRKCVFTTTTNKKLRWTEIFKGDFSGYGNANALGKKLANAGELATIVSLTKDIKKPEDTGQQIFVENYDAYCRWQDTFKNTKPKLLSIIGSLTNYEIIHDATARNNAIADAFVKMAKILGVSKDAFCPADIYIVQKNKKTEIANKYKEILEANMDSETKALSFNSATYGFYEAKMLYPVSLKQLNGIARVDYSNEPKANETHPFYSVENIQCNPTLTEGKEIGVISFRLDSRKMVTMQNRGFPHGFTVTQTEITNDGSNSGGRLGKVPTNVIDKIMSKYGSTRISSVRFFGQKIDGKWMENALKGTTIKELYEMWLVVAKEFHKTEYTNKEDFKRLFDLANTDEEKAKSLCVHIQGMVFLYFIIKNKKNVSEIVTALVNGAKKISKTNSFFIKIY